MAKIRKTAAAIASVPGNASSRKKKQNVQSEDDEIIVLDQSSTSSKSPACKNSTRKDAEKIFLRAPRVLRSHKKPLVLYDISSLKRKKRLLPSPKTQNESTSSSESRKARCCPPLLREKIPELPYNYNQIMNENGFKVKGRKQRDHSFGKLKIKGYDLYTLRPRQYVNDNIIDNYFKLIAEESLKNPTCYRKTFAFDTYFYTMLEKNGETQNTLLSMVKKDLFDYELLYCPINQQNHWLLFVADLKAKNYFIYDSLYHGDYSIEAKNIVNFLNFYAERTQNKIEWSPNATNEQYGPSQTNSVDCGVFICQYAEHLARKAIMDFSQAGMLTHRKLMLYELINGELLPKNDDANLNQN